MDLAQILSFLQSGFYLLLIFIPLLILTLWRGRYFLINLIIALNLAMFLTWQIPEYKALASNFIFYKSLGFGLFTIVIFFILRRHIPGDDFEKVFSNFWQKLLLVIVTTILLIITINYFYPLESFLTVPDTLEKFIIEPSITFWWLLFSLAILLFV